jgi:hypothetical protein
MSPERSKGGRPRREIDTAELPPTGTASLLREARQNRGEVMGGSRLARPIQPSTREFRTGKAQLLRDQPLTCGRKEHRSSDNFVPYPALNRRPDSSSHFEIFSFKASNYFTAAINADQ